MFIEVDIFQPRFGVSNVIVALLRSAIQFVRFGYKHLAPTEPSSALWNKRGTAKWQLVMPSEPVIDFSLERAPFNTLAIAAHVWTSLLSFSLRAEDAAELQRWSHSRSLFQPGQR